MTNFVLLSGFPYRKEAGEVSGCETTVTQGTYLPSQHRGEGLPRMRVKNSWFALKGVFTLKHGKQVLAATSNMTGIFGSLLSAKTPTALLFLLLFKFLPFQIVDAFHHIMRSLGRERADTAF